MSHPGRCFLAQIFPFRFFLNAFHALETGNRFQGIFLPANHSLVEGRLELRRGMLVFAGINGIEIEHWLEHIENPRIKLGRIVFDYDGKPIEGYSCSLAKRWIEILRLALNGKYPACEDQNYSAVEKYILENFIEETREDAVKYFMDLSGCDYQDSSIVVRRILG